MEGELDTQELTQWIEILQVKMMIIPVKVQSFKGIF